jgi:hypothetical protein
VRERNDEPSGFMSTEHAEKLQVKAPPFLYNVTTAVHTKVKVELIGKPILHF